MYLIQKSNISAIILLLIFMVLPCCRTTIEDEGDEIISVDPEEPKDTARTPAVIDLSGKPPEMYVSDDGKRLVTGGRYTSSLYDSAVIRKFYLTFAEPNFWTILQNNYNSKADLAATLKVDDKTFENVGVRFKGETSYRQVFQTSQKLSFNLSMQYIPTNPKLMTYRTLNFNNAFQDPSFLREVLFYRLARQHIPAARANFINLYINGENWGLYPNVQQLNKDFLEEWFFTDDGANWRAEGISPGGAPQPGGGGGWGNGRSGLNYLGDNVTAYQSNYTLKSSDIDDHWERLAAACKALNNTPAVQMTEDIPKYFDVDRILWHLACEIAFTDEDSYVFKGQQDYYVYFEPETERITTLEYDANSTLRPNLVSWSPFYNESKVNYPLLNKLLAVPEYRQRYLAHLRTIIDQQMDPAYINRILDNYKTQIDALVQADPKKLYSYSQFTEGVNTLRNFFITRRGNLRSNPEVAQPAPAIQDVSYKNLQGKAWTAPTGNTAVNVTAKVGSSAGISRVTLFYCPSLLGNFTRVEMKDDGKQGDGASNDGVYGATVPGMPAGTYVRFYLEAASSNAVHTVSYDPAGAEHDVYFYQVKTD